MYAIELVQCSSYNHALALRRILEADGFPAVAGEVFFLDETLHIVAAAAPHNYPDALVEVAERWGAVLGLDKLTNHLKSLKELSYAVPQESRELIRRALLMTLTMSGNVIRSEPATPAAPTSEHAEKVMNALSPEALADEHDTHDNWKPERAILH